MMSLDLNQGILTIFDSLNSLVCLDIGYLMYCQVAQWQDSATSVTLNLQLGDIRINSFVAFLFV